MTTITEQSRAIASSSTLILPAAQGQIRVPYAASYLQYADFDAPDILSLLPSSWEKLSGVLSTRDGLNLVGFANRAEHTKLKGSQNPRARTGMLPPQLNTYYYELIITGGSTSVVNVGFGSSMGDMLSEVTFRQPQIGPRRTGIVGVGFILSPLALTLLVTDNGRCLATPWVIYGPSDLRLRPTVLIVDGNPTIQANFGQAPFTFDIEGYCKRRAGRLRELTTTIPEDILEEILEQSLYPRQTESLYKFSLVCRRWHSLCIPHLLDTVRLRRLKHATAITPRALPLVHTLHITEFCDSSIWFHAFAVSGSPSAMKTLKSLHRDIAGDCSNTYDKFLPPRMSDTLPSLLRHGFSHIQSSSFTNYHFGSWTAFAKLVLCFPQLQSLRMVKIRWENDVDLPPAWLRSPGCLRRIESSDIPAWYGMAWLLIAPARAARTPLTPALNIAAEDLRALARIFRLLSEHSMISALKKIVLKEEKDQYILELCASSDRADAVEARFLFEAAGGGLHRLQALDIFLSRNISKVPTEAFLELSHCFMATTTGETCHCTFDLSAFTTYFVQRKNRLVLRIRDAMRAQVTRGLLLFSSLGKPLLVDDCGVHCEHPETSSLRGTAMEFLIQYGFQ